MTRNGEAGFSRRLPGKRDAAIAVLTAASVLVCQAALADEGGVSVWLPGFFGSLAASPLQPGWSLTSIYYHTTVSAGADVAKAREITIGRIPANLNVNVSASVDARADLALALPTYTFATPVLGAQATVGVLGLYGRTSTSLAAQLSGTLTTPFGTLPFSRFDSINDAVTGFGDVYPLATLRWNNGVHNVMTYVFGDVPVGAYDSTRLSNIGVGHGAIGLVGYVYQEVGCDSGSGDRVGCFQSRVVGVGPQLGFIIPLTTTVQGYLNIKGYKEFAAQNRPDGWNTWVTFVISPAEQTPSAPPRRMFMK